MNAAEPLGSSDMLFNTQASGSERTQGDGGNEARSQCAPHGLGRHMATVPYPINPR
ncbi:hypothetical protein ACEUCJ_08985 [Aeromonas rivipollensis]|uniref:hypothetical protein n=1 Tax=Aeromonas rivipollensis TaxID=948519 RepID=UPI0038CFA4B1